MVDNMVISLSSWYCVVCGGFN